MGEITPLTILLILTSVVLSLIIPISSQSLKNFGDPCSGDCDERLGLTCSTTSNQCECVLANFTIFDTTRSHCVTKAGSPCRRIITPTTSSPTSSALAHLCVPHASCPSLNLNCECDSHYFQTRNGTCAPTAGYSESCSSRRPCDKSNGIECVSSSKSKQYTCLCKFPRDQYYDSAQKKCISYPSGNCSFTLPCVKNAKCSQDIFELRRGETPHGKSYMYNATVGKKCLCDEGYTATKTRECLPSYQTNCGDTNYFDNSNRADVCNPEESLKCFDNKICLCQSPLHQVYSKKKNKCLNLVGSRCFPPSEDENSEESGCVQGAVCERVDQSQDAVCKCKTGFSTTVSRRCLKDFGQVCGRQEEGECNFGRGLSCQNGSCGCIDDFLSYSSSTQSCRSGKGSPCGEFYLEKDTNGKEMGFIMDADAGRSNYPPAERADINFKRLTIQCDSGNGLTCQTRDGYQQCV